MSRKFLLYALLCTGCLGRDIREEVDPLLQDTDETVGVKEKRCPRVRAETPGNAPAGIVGSTQQQPQQQPLQLTLNQHLCQTCQNRHACRVLKNCEACSKWCDDPQNLQSRSNFEEIDYPLITLNEGVLKDSITNLLGVENGADVDRLTCSVTTRSGKPPGINSDQQKVLNDPQELFERVRKRIRESLMGRVKEQEVNCLSTEDIEKLLDDILRNVTSPIKLDSVVSSSSRASFSEPIDPIAETQPIIVPQALNPPIIEGTLDPSKLDNPQLAMETPVEPISQIAPNQNMQNLAAQTGEFKTQGAKLRDFYQRLKGKASEMAPSSLFLRGKSQEKSENPAKVTHDPNNFPTEVKTKGLIEKLRTENIPQDNLSSPKSGDEGLGAPNLEQQSVTLEENPPPTPADKFESSPGNLDPNVHTASPESDDFRTRSHHLIEKIKAKKHQTVPTPHHHHHHHHHSRSGTEELEVTAPPVDIPLALNQQIVDQEVAEETPIQQLTTGDQTSMEPQESDLASPLINNPDNVDPNIQTASPENDDDSRTRTHHLLEKLKAKKHRAEGYPSGYPYYRSGSDNVEGATSPIDVHQELDPSLDKGIPIEDQHTSPTIPSVEQNIPEKTSQQIASTDPSLAQEAPEEETRSFINGGEDPVEAHVSNLGSAIVNTEDNVGTFVSTEAPVNSDLKTRTHQLIQKLKAKKQRTEAYPSRYPYLREGTEDLENGTPQLNQEVPEVINQAVDLPTNQEVAEATPPIIAEENSVPTQQLITGEENPLDNQETNFGPSVPSEDQDANTETAEGGDLKTRTHHLIQKLKAKQHRTESYPSRYPYSRSEDGDMDRGTLPLNQVPEEINQQTSAVDLPLNQEVAEETPQQLMVGEENIVPVLQVVTEDESPVQTQQLIDEDGNPVETQVSTLGSSLVDDPDPTVQTDAAEGSDSKARTHHLIQKLKAKKHRAEKYPSRYSYYRSGTEDLESATPPQNQEVPEEIDQTTSATEPSVNHGVADKKPQQFATVEENPGSTQQLVSREEDSSVVLETTDPTLQSAEAEIDSPKTRTHHLLQRLKAKKLKTESYPSRYPYSRSETDDLESVIPQTDSSPNPEELELGDPLTTEHPVDISETPLGDLQAKDIDGLRARTHQLLQKFKSRNYKTDGQAYSRSGDQDTTEAFLGSEPEGSDVFMRDNDNVRSHHGHHRGKGHHHRGHSHHRSNEQSEESDETSERDLDPTTEAMFEEDVANSRPQETSQVPHQESSTENADLLGDQGPDRDNFARNHKLLEKIKRKKVGHRHRTSEDEGMTEEQLPTSLSARTHQLMENIREKLEKFNRNSDASTERPELGHGEVKQFLPRHGAVEEGKDPKLEEVLQQVETLMKNLERTLPPPPDQKEILGSQPLENSLEVYSVPTHPKAPPRPYDVVGSAHEGDMYFISNGIKLPLRQVRKEDGAVHLAIDLDRLCSCNNITCQKNETLERAVGSILEKEPELKEILEEPELQVVLEKEPHLQDPLDFADVPLGSPHIASRFLGDSGELQHENSGILKRSPTRNNDIPKELLQTTTTSFTTNTNPIETTTSDSLAKIQKSSAYLKEYLSNKLSDLRSKLEPQPKSGIPMFTRFQKWLQSFDPGQDSNVLLPLTKQEDTTFQKWLKSVTPANEKESVLDNSEQSNLQLIEKELRDKMEQIDEYNRRNGEIIQKESNAAESAILREEIGIMGNFLKWLKGVVNSNNSTKK